VFTPLRLADVGRAWDARDPQLVNLIVRLAEQPDEEPEAPIADETPTFSKYLTAIHSRDFRRKPRSEQAQYRQEQMKVLEAADAAAPLPERLRLYDILLALWQDNGPFAHTCLLRIIAAVKLTYGPWRALKQIFKEAEARGDTEVYGALVARIDAASAAGLGFDIGRGTLAYLRRRGWRFLRRLAVRLPACYADTAVDVLAHYPADTRWDGTWVANQIFYHETGSYSRGSFSFPPRPASLIKHRAFADLWRRTPRPLFSLLERAQSDLVRGFAASALRTDFRASLREVEPGWVARLVSVGSRTIDEFVVWILNNVPRFEQAAFHTLGLHDAVLRLFDSPAPEARVYAADYARTHARDLPVADLIRLANNNHEAVHKLACDLLHERDARKEVGLDAWGQLLETRHGHALAAAMLRKHYGARELTPEWFKDRLLSPSDKAREFAKAYLPQVHPYQELGPGFFADLIDRIDDIDNRATGDVPASARRVPGQSLQAIWQLKGTAYLGPVLGDVLAGLLRFDVNALAPDLLRRLLLQPLSSPVVCAWINEGRLKALTLGVDFLKSIAYHPAWETDPWVAQLKAGPRAWAQHLPFNEALADQVLAWLRDVRRFSPAELGFDWLMQLVVRSEPRYHDFAVETMVKAFVPADFAPKETAAAPAAAHAAPTTVDLQGASFLFTGKLATMQRKEAEDKVRKANGVVSSTVSAKLYYLVIGDEGSPLYGQGKKGSKQVRAEELNAAGSNIRIISETMFLQMLSGGQRSFSEDATLAGCHRLWQMAVAPGPADAPLAHFAIQYLRRHHPDICLAETDRPVDPGAEIPASFLTFAQVQPLFGESRKPLRDFALELARWEFARWAPPAAAIIQLCELPYVEVRQFVAQALLADDTAEHRRYRLDPALLTPAAVYSFCESPDEATRELGMELIRRSPRLQLPEELFRLTESPDRKVRAFVIRALWSLYRDRGIKADWKPYIPPAATVGVAAKKAAVAAAEDRGTGAPPRPEHLPAGHQGLRDFLRRILFEIPPARLQPPKVEEGSEGITVRLRPLPHRRAKLELVEVMRDLALEDVAFAREVQPLLQEFMTSRGQSEQAACLVAVTRIRHRHPQAAAGGGA
jgi:hypothetical protein